MATHPRSTTRRLARRATLLAAAASAAFGGLAACGNDDTPATSPVASTTTTPVAEGNEVPIALNDYSIAVPSKLTAGPTRFVATNHGKEEHQMTLVHLRDGQTLGDVLGALSGDTAQAIEDSQLVVGPQAVAPGATQEVAVDLPAGDYVALCAIPSPSDGMPHAAKGMVAQFTVTGPRTKGTAVPSGPTIELHDYSFTLPDDFDGRGLFRVENDGKKPHEVAVYRVAAGKTYEDAKAYLTTTPPPSGPSPVTPMGGVTIISPGQVGATALDLDPGTYVFLCFVPGTDGQQHFQHGMIRKVVLS
jgi:uncharacterized cupredoxin-like copper-binding protein